MLIFIELNRIFLPTHGIIYKSIETWPRAVESFVNWDTTKIRLPKIHLKADEEKDSF